MPYPILRPEAVFDGHRLVRGVALRLSDPPQIVPDPPADARPVGGIVSPGLIDLQVNGGGGVLFNADPTPEGIAAILAAHRRFGTTRLLPTLITDAPEVAEAVAAAIRAVWGTPGLLGLHLEGPHIAPARRGTHAARHIRPLDDRTLTLAESLRADGIPLLLTLAPEAATLAQIARLSAAGVVVSLGHSDATAVETEAALAAGAGNFTHIFNAMSQMQGREPGMVGAAILSDAEIGLICDGHHVSDAMLTLALRAHGAGRCHIVSDAMPTVGGPDHFTLYGQTIRVADGRLINAEGRLAGAHTTMAEGVARLVNTLGQSLETALRMAITNPARIIGADPSLESQPAADLLLWDAALKPRFLTDALG